jgi:hypothetical protein
MESATHYDFAVSKHAGKWTVDTLSIQTTYDLMTNCQLDSDATGR